MRHSTPVVSVSALLVAFLAACDQSAGSGQFGEVDADGSGPDTSDDTSDGDAVVDPDATADSGDNDVDGIDGDTSVDSDADAGATDADEQDAIDADASDADPIDADTGDTAENDAVDADADAVDTGDTDAAEPDVTDAGTDTTETDTSDAGIDVIDPPRCGDGVVNGTDECDGADLDGFDCRSLGFAAGTLGCDAACSFDTSFCSETDICGDRYVGETEACEPGLPLGADCPDFDFVGGTLSCTECQLDDSTCSEADVCGDRIVGDTEDCDFGDTADGDGCTALCLVCTEDGSEPNDTFSQFRAIGYPSSTTAVAQTGDSDNYRVLLGPGCLLDASVEYAGQVDAVSADVYATDGEFLGEGIPTAVGTETEPRTRIDLDWIDPFGGGFSSRHVIIRVESTALGGCVDYTLEIRARCG